MKIDEITQRMFLNEIDNQYFREPNKEEITQAMNIHRIIIPKKKSWLPMTLAAACLGCLLVAVSFSSISREAFSIQPLAKAITMKLPENPKEQVFAFVSSIQF
jgi:hypothetical protein